MMIRILNCGEKNTRRNLFEKKQKSRVVTHWFPTSALEFPDFQTLFSRKTKLPALDRGTVQENSILIPRKPLEMCGKGPPQV